MALRAAKLTNFNVYILLMDMFKEIDAIYGSILLNYLRMILEDNELHLIYNLIDDIKLTGIVRKLMGKKFKTIISYTSQGPVL